MTGEPGSSPVKCGAPVVDYATGTTAAAAILAALLHRKNCGHGQFVEVAMSDVALILCSSHLTGHLWNGWHPEQKGNRYPFATIGCYQAADAPLMISASNLRQQRRLWEVLERPDLIKKSNRERIGAHGAESEALRQIIGTMAVEHGSVCSKRRACRHRVSSEWRRCWQTSTSSHAESCTDLTGALAH